MGSPQKPSGIFQTVFVITGNRTGRGLGKHFIQPILPLLSTNVRLIDMNILSNKYLSLVPPISLFIILFTLFWFGGKWFWIEVWFIVEIFVLTFLTRTVSSRISVSIFSRGIYISVGLSLLIYSLALGIGLKADTFFTSGILIPFVEEFAKFLPVLFVTYFLYKRQKKVLNPSDYLWISVLSGAGFSMIEKMYFGDISFSYTYGPHLGGLYFFPDALSARGIGYIGHAAATGLIGMCFGLGIYLKSKIKSLKKVWWILPVVGYGWIVLEHTIVNLSFIDYSNTLLLLGGGEITPIAFLLLLVPTLAISFYGIRDAIKKHPVIKKAFFGESKKIMEKVRDKKWMEGVVLGRKTVRMLRRFNIFVWQKTINR